MWNICVILYKELKDSKLYISLDRTLQISIVI